MYEVVTVQVHIPSCFGSCVPLTKGRIQQVSKIHAFLHWNYRFSESKLRAKPVNRSHEITRWKRESKMVYKNKRTMRK